MEYKNTLDFARQMDSQDPLRSYRSRFHIPTFDDKEAIYLCGNSLGLQAKGVRTFIDEILTDWQNLGVEGHMHARHPWMTFHHLFNRQAAGIVGAKPAEVVLMNTLTVNLHLMMVSFFKPTDKRFKIMVEGQLFPSDHYAVESQLRFHGYDPDEGIIEINPDKGSHTISTNQILDAIEKHKDQLSLILFGGVNYYSGQLFDMEAITAAGHEAGAMVGFDLAHAAGNVPLKLHHWGVDFAVWCTYKYLNAGPGAVGGVFVHEKHGKNPGVNRFAGWWGYREDTRFDMKKGFLPMEGAAGWQCSNAPVMNMAAHKISLNIFEEAGMQNIREKSKLLTGYLEFILKECAKEKGLGFQIITPADPEQRGSQLSVLTDENGPKIFEKLKKNGIIADWRKPNVIRLSPTPLYNTFEDIYRVGEIISS